MPEYKTGELFPQVARTLAAYLELPEWLRDPIVSKIIKGTMNNMKKTGSLVYGEYYNEAGNRPGGFVMLLASNGKEVMRSDNYHSVFNTKRAKGDIVNAMVEALRLEGYKVIEPKTNTNTKTMTAG